MGKYVKSVNYSDKKNKEDNLIKIYTNIKKGMIYFDILGFSKKDSNILKEKIKSAFNFLSLKFPYGNISIVSDDDFSSVNKNLELPIFISILNEIKPIQDIDKYLIVGEMDMEGKCKKVFNPYRIVRFAKENNIKEIIMPYGNYNFLNDINDIKFYYFKNLKELINFFYYNKKLETKIKEEIILDKKTEININDIKNQNELIRALIIAIAGKHNLFIKGPIGSGKSFSIKAIESILPKLEENKILLINDMKARYSNNDEFSEKSFFVYPPTDINNRNFFGNSKNLGMVSILNHSFLVLDEINLFNKSFLNNIKIMMDANSIFSFDKIKYLEYPINFSIIAIMNPCPCGNLGTNTKCKCTIGDISRFNAKIDKSFLDRFDLKISVNNTEFSIENKIKYDIEKIKKDLENINEIQKNRYTSLEKMNGNLNSKDIGKYIYLSDEVKSLLETINHKYKISKRAMYSLIKVARTIADLDFSGKIKEEHILEALNYQIRL